MMYIWTGKSCKTLKWLGAAQIHNIPRIEGILASQLVVGTHRIKTHDFPSYETKPKIISHSTCMYILLNTGSNIFPFTFDFNYVHLSVDNNIGFFNFDFIYLIHSVWVYYFNNSKGKKYMIPWHPDDSALLRYIWTIRTEIQTFILQNTPLQNVSMCQTMISTHT